MYISSASCVYSANEIKKIRFIFITDVILDRLRHFHTHLMLAVFKANTPLSFACATKLAFPADADDLTGLCVLPTLGDILAGSRSFLNGTGRGERSYAK